MARSSGCRGQVIISGAFPSGASEDVLTVCCLWDTAVFPARPGRDHGCDEGEREEEVEGKGWRGQGLVGAGRVRGAWQGGR